ncbi:bifunctional 4-hydroxy-2-oxoglutarate aldolase/2-dehydro-3-deoxy-phosphogluconate aldolase [Amnibacterium sp. CER49]|uniref:bifunctional 4-hydroxy-2-oxoglutarate aldolase/2-dehydro-3-deoxy-phosphogluconate aldolase n=1 Tax=Amnibacterium sp. CER49 TaxID=3039161 RepID=UPI00244828F8|nr:bifunctional 4-hydroxy-2-oxoglutarate aldolase/2-dehydro-3-deoxy-phosphogluconate aldolase [Amnibacterium sp. CER49]MDH2442845.1 bifunctional 4-hydroxy-2-oxoglutarate aldolase/2-dehydro-3-deoxy-phosphogluconate aldolase [Amnibacterium sp. CER49]
MTITPDESNEWFDRMLQAIPLMAILRGQGPARSVELAVAAWELGITLVEVPIQTAEDVASFRAARDARPDRALGVGTVIGLEELRAAERIGAQFVVSPGIDAVVVTESLARGIPILPGVATPTDLQLAFGLGLRWVKAFPASVLGTEWIRAMQGPFPAARFVATGGIDARNASDFLAAGARAVAVGSALRDPQELARVLLAAPGLAAPGLEATDLSAVLRAAVEPG